MSQETRMNEAIRLLHENPNCINMVTGNADTPEAPFEVWEESTLTNHRFKTFDEAISKAASILSERK